MHPSLATTNTRPLPLVQAILLHIPLNLEAIQHLIHHNLVLILHNPIPDILRLLMPLIHLQGILVKIQVIPVTLLATHHPTRVTLQVRTLLLTRQWEE